MYEHRYREKINKLYKYSGKCDDQHQYKDIIEVKMISTTEEITDDSTMSPSPYVTVKNKTAALRLGDAKPERKTIKAGSVLWPSIPKRPGQKKLKNGLRIFFNDWILQHPQVVQSPISNDWLKVSIAGHYEPQVATKLFLFRDKQFSCSPSISN